MKFWLFILFPFFKINCMNNKILVIIGKGVGFVTRYLTSHNEIFMGSFYKF